MPKLAHTKTRKGCLRCKVRKVKCDLVHPVCSACERHSVTCEYGENIIRLDPSGSRPRNQPANQARKSQQLDSNRHDHLPSQTSSYSKTVANDQLITTQSPSNSPSVSTCTSRILELRLLHHFTAFTSVSFAPAGLEVWCRTAPLIAFSHEFLLDAILALAALHLSKLNPQDEQVLQASRKHFQRALEGQSRAFAKLDDQSTSEALFLTTTLITLHALVLSANENEDFGNEESAPFRWLRIGSGGRIMYRACRSFLDDSTLLSALFASKPDLVSDDVVFDPANRGDLQQLLEWGTDFESISKEDMDAYEETVSFVGLMYKSADNDEEVPFGTCRRVLAMPSRCPERFMELVEERRPRAIAILVYFFAAIKLIKADLWWSAGISERYVGILRDLLPKGWRAMIEMPLRLVFNPQD